MGNGGRVIICIRLDIGWFRVLGAGRYAASARSKGQAQRHHRQHSAAQQGQAGVEVVGDTHSRDAGWQSETPRPLVSKFDVISLTEHVPLLHTALLGQAQLTPQALPAAHRGLHTPPSHLCVPAGHTQVGVHCAPAAHVACSSGRAGRECMRDTGPYESTQLEGRADMSCKPHPPASQLPLWCP